MDEAEELRRRALLLRALRVLVAVATVGLSAGAIITATLAGAVLLPSVALGLALVARGAAHRWPGRVPPWAAVAALAGTAGVMAVQAGSLSVAQMLVLVVVADAGLTLGGAAGGGLGLLAGVVVPLAAGAPVDPWITATAILAGLATGLVRIPPPISTGEAVHAVANTLDELLRLSERLPGGLDVWSVASGIRTELAAASGSADAHLVVVREGILHGIGEPWGRRPVGLLEEARDAGAARGWTTLDRGDLPAGLRRALQHERWAARLLVHGESVEGLVLVPAPLSRTQRRDVDAVVDSATVALAGATRFEQLQRVARDAARLRVAHDLHDGVAQQLTHVRFELELLELSDTVHRDDLTRLRSVADAALSEVRRTVDQLHTDAPLQDRLPAHVEQLRGFARAQLSLRVTGQAEVGQETSDDVMGVAQEAISNALRHADASSIDVRLDLHPDVLVLSVEDDGVGLPRQERRRRGRGGVGLEAMRTRAVRLGGRLDLGPRPEGGTALRLAVPLGGNRRWVPSDTDTSHDATPTGAAR